MTRELWDFYPEGYIPKVGRKFQKAGKVRYKGPVKPRRFSWVLWLVLVTVSLFQVVGATETPSASLNATLKVQQHLANPCVLSVPYSLPVHGWFSQNLGVSLGAGMGTRDIVPLRLGLQAELNKRWLAETLWPVSCYLELSFYHLEGKRDVTPWSNARLQAIALTPVFRFEYQHAILEQACPYVELAVGASLLSKKEIAGRALGTHFEFEDRLGAGIRFGSNKEFDFSYRFIHFSNANLAKYNHGINLHFLILGYWF